MEEQWTESRSGELECRTSRQACYLPEHSAPEALEQAWVAVYLACFHCRRVLDLGPAREEVSAGQAGQLAWAGCSGRMRREEEEDLGNLGQEEDRREACHSQAVGVRIRSQEQRLGRLGNHAVRQGPGTEPVVGTEAEAGQEGSRKEGTAAAAGQADRGIGEAADGVSVAAVAELGGLTAIIVSLHSAHVLCPIYATSTRLRAAWQLVFLHNAAAPTAQWQRIHPSSIHISSQALPDSREGMKTYSHDSRIIGHSRRLVLLGRFYH